MQVALSSKEACMFRVPKAKDYKAIVCMPCQKKISKQNIRTFPVQYLTTASNGHLPCVLRLLVKQCTYVVLKWPDLKTKILNDL